MISARLPLHTNSLWLEFLNTVPDHYATCNGRCVASAYFLVAFLAFPIFSRRLTRSRVGMFIGPCYTALSQYRSRFDLPKTAGRLYFRLLATHANLWVSPSLTVSEASQNWVNQSMSRVLIGTARNVCGGIIAHVAKVVHRTAEFSHR